MTIYSKKVIDLTGQRFGRWTVISFSEIRNHSAYWNCQCDCGTESKVDGHGLRRGRSKSCGCFNLEVRTTHGLDKHRFIKTWRHMNDRCYNTKDKEYKNYGGRGITICDEWRGDPTAFCAWCDSQEPVPKEYSIDRINNDGNYCPENCRFASNHQQQRNKTNTVWIDYNNETLCLQDFIEKYAEVPLSIVKNRIYDLGWNPIKAAFTKKRTYLE